MRFVILMFAAVLLTALDAAEPVKVILDTDMSGDCDDAGALALLHALANRGECELLATIVNRRDKTNASAAAVDAINTYYGRPDLPIGTDKQGPTDLQRVSPYAEALRDEFPNDIGPDGQAPDAFHIYQRTLAAQPDHSVTICSVGALSNLAELWRRDPDLVRSKVKRLVIMGGEFPTSSRPETNVRTHREASQFVAAHWPGEIVWHGLEIGKALITGERLKGTPASNPVRRAYELRRFQNRPSIDGGQPSYDQAAALYAVRCARAEFWEVVTGGRVQIDAEGMSVWQADPAGKHAYVKIAGDPGNLAAAIEELMVEPPVRALLDPSEDLVSPEVRAARNRVYHVGGGYSILNPPKGPPGAPPPPPPPSTTVDVMALDELPLADSDAVLVGEVLSEQPFLTQDGAGFYTEYNVKAFEVVKSDWVKAQDLIASLWRGGRAHLPDGRTVESTVSGLGDKPLLGRQYLMFLSYRPAADAYLFRKLWLIEDGDLEAQRPDDLARVHMGRSIYHGKPLLAALADLRLQMSSKTGR